MKLKARYEFISETISFFQNTWILLGIVILAASIFRLTNLTLIEFKGDESLNLFLATRPLFGHPFPPASLASSVGILNFPLLNYLLFPIVLISYYPPFVSGCIALLNVLAIGAYFLILTKYTNRLIAFMTTILLSLAPWAILYSRKIWAQDFLIPLVVALLFCFFKIYKERKQLYWLFFGFVALLLVQIHQTAGILPVLLFFPLIQKNRPHIAFLILGILMGFLPAVPYILYEFVNHCPDCSTLSLLHGKLQTFHPDIFLRSFQITTTGDFHTILGNTDYFLFTSRYALIAKFTKTLYIIYALLPLTAILFWVKLKEYRSFLIATLLILCVFFFIKIQPEMHYFIILLPFLFLFVGAGLSTMLYTKNIFLKLGGVGVFLLFIFTYASFDYAFFHLLSIKKGFGGDYGGTYAVAEQSGASELKAYKTNPSYKEMVLAYYVPKESVRGSTPVGQILYPLTGMQRTISLLNEKLQHNPPDPRLVNQLTAYYTYPQNLTDENIFYLRQQSKKFVGFQTLYNLALSDYLYTNHKHYYTDVYFWIEYPEHWKESRLDSKVMFSDENVAFTLFFTPQNLPADLNGWTSITKAVAGEQVTEYTCIKEDVWCGSLVPTIPLDGKLFSIALSPITTNIDQTTLTKEWKVLENILDTTKRAVY